MPTRRWSRRLKTQFVDGDDLAITDPAGISSRTTRRRLRHAIHADQ
jgi:hypothetical protein